MPDVTSAGIEEMEAVQGFATFRRARAALHLTAFGMSIVDMPPKATGYPEHDHAGELAGQQAGQEEVYVALRGSGVLEAEGERHPLDPDHIVRVGPGTKRKIIPGDDGLRLLALGGVPGEAYKPAGTTS
jgi:mannose-6-phosphate isomerase-like protein (cupin superfamily)